MSFAFLFVVGVRLLAYSFNFCIICAVGQSSYCLVRWSLRCLLCLLLVVLAVLALVLVVTSIPHRVGSWVVRWAVFSRSIIRPDVGLLVGLVVVMV